MLEKISINLDTGSYMFHDFTATHHNVCSQMFKFRFQYFPSALQLFGDHFEMPHFLEIILKGKNRGK